MNNQNKYKSEINLCFNELRGIFSQGQSFYITLGVAAIKWISLSEKYSSLKRFTEGYSDMLYLQNDLECFENQFLEFKGVLTGILDAIFVYKDNSAKQKVKKIFDIVGREFSSEDEIRIFINKLVRIGLGNSGYIETPDVVKKLLVGLINFDTINSFADYCCGTSAIALEIFKHLDTNNLNKDMCYYGEEINAPIFLVSKLLMIINGIDRYEILNNDVLVTTNRDEDLKFDLVISDFPQVIYRSKELAYNDPRFKYGVPTRSSADWAYCQNVLYHLNETGQGIVIGTKGTLVRNNDVDIRKNILKDDLIECVITLPVNLYENTNIGTEMIIFNKNKDKNRRNRILFINASTYSYRLNRNQHNLTDEGIRKIVECYKNGIEENHFSKFVESEKIKESGYTLNPIEYLDFDTLKNSFTNSVALKDIAKITRGVQLSKEGVKQLTEDGTHYYLNVKDIENGRVNYDEDFMITNKKNDWIGKYDIRPDDIIITSKGSTVKISIVEDDFKPAFISGNLTRIRIDPKKYNAYVLYEFLQSEVGVKMIEGIQTGTTIKLLNTSQLERLELPTFKIELMNDIGNKIKNNKNEYEKTVKSAKQKFDENREKLLESLKSHY